MVRQQPSRVTGKQKELSEKKIKFKQHLCRAFIFLFGYFSPKYFLAYATVASSGSSGREQYRRSSSQMKEKA